MNWMVKNATIITMDEHNGTYEGGDVVVSNRAIVALGHNLDSADYEIERIVDGRDYIVIPGLVNAHLHSHDRFDRGQYDNLPLEIWSPVHNANLAKRNWTPRECYLRTALGCIEMLKQGVTTVIDDVNHGLPLREENIDAVYQAYSDLGIRALATIAYSDRPFTKNIPYLEGSGGSSMLEELARKGPDASDVISIWKSFAERWNGRVKFILSCSVIQRSSDAFLEQVWGLSNELDLPVIVHILETKMQASDFHAHYGRGVIDHMASLGILSHRTALVHSIWVDQKDIAAIARSGASVIHNPVSNLKLGSGIAPIRQMVEQGINVGLGTDNICVNDSVNMFESMKLAALISRLSDYDFRQWLRAKDVLRMATAGGAECGGIDSIVGSISIGKKADLVLLNAAALTYLPKNNLVNQMVFSETGASVKMVSVDGRIVVEDGVVTTVDEDEIVSEATESMVQIREMITARDKIDDSMKKSVMNAYQVGLQDRLGISVDFGTSTDPELNL